ncbi:MAG: hypothetical protein HYX68_01135 [Planctomycetes bacterium]|nr:hypothetical protein [Planctomycetota bacterium]
MSVAEKKPVPGIALFHEDYYNSDASTIAEHLDSFGRYSRFPIYLVNLAFGFPPGLQDYEFSACVFSYTLRPTIHWLTPDLENYLNSCPRSYRVAIFQDEVWYFQERFSFLKRCKIDCLYSRHKPRHVRDIYAEHVPVKDYVHYLAGYVAEDLVARAASLAQPYRDRRIDVGYRGRRLPFYMGRGGQEKAEIGRRFLELAAGRGLCLDIALEERDRLYGEAWHRYLAGCKAVLGVEGGVSIIDRSGEFCRRSERILKENPDLTFDEFANHMGADFIEQEDKIDYRSLTPRHFEAAAFRNLQILFEGNYDGLMEPGVHYVPLRKDFSNMEEVLLTLKNPERCLAIVNRAYHDLIASGRFTYAQFIRDFDQRLIAAGVKEPGSNRPVCPSLTAYLANWTAGRVQTQDFSALVNRRHQEKMISKELFERASELLCQQAVDLDRRRVGDYSSCKRWLERNADRAFFAQLGRVLGVTPPSRPVLAWLQDRPWWNHWQVFRFIRLALRAYHKYRPLRGGPGLARQ